VVYGVNCGGEAHVDVYGVNYLRDNSKVGTSSDYGKQLLIGRVPQRDQILYQTERYHTSTFGYDIPLRDDGRYLLILKFSEVYFNAPNMKVYNIMPTDTVKYKIDKITTCSLSHFVSTKTQNDIIFKMSGRRGKYVLRSCFYKKTKLIYLDIHVFCHHHILWVYNHTLCFTITFSIHSE
jgi:hypothetical protein